MSSSDNRRSAFRVNDQVSLAVRPLELNELPIIEAGFDAYRLHYCITSHLDHQRKQQLPLMRRVESNDPDIAKYLMHLENQIQRLADQVTREDSDNGGDNAILVEVDLSASGMRFRSSRNFQPEQHLELVLRLMPAVTTVLTVARVVRSRPIEVGGGYMVSVEFEILHEEDREALIQHVIGVQNTELQKRWAG
ncbi:MAG: PilZ domain-containing protein [Granulosicoccus sp.]